MTTRFSNEPNMISLEVDAVLAETPDAILVEFEGSRIWLPKSQLEDWPNIDDGGEILIQEWLAIEKELI